MKSSTSTSASIWEGAISAAFREHGWKVTPNSRYHAAGQGHEVDLVVRKRGLTYVVEVKSSSDARRPVLVGLLADGILRSRAAAKTLGGQPLAVVASPHISDAMASALRHYAEDFAPDAAYGLLDAGERFELHGPGLEDVRPTEPSVSPVGRPSLTRPVDIFSDRNQWLLKVLLAQHVPERLLRAPRGSITNFSTWAAAAAVSLASAARLADVLSRDGFLEVRRRSLELVRLRELFDRWRAANRRPVGDVAARYLFGRPGRGRSTAAIARYLEARGASSSPGALGARVCLGLFSACEHLGFRFVHGVPDFIYAEEPSPSVLDGLGLVQSEPGERIDVMVRRPRWREAVFRGCVTSQGARPTVPVADVIQCWLDLVDHPARGREQADVIWKSVLQDLVGRADG